MRSLQPSRWSKYISTRDRTAKMKKRGPGAESRTEELFGPPPANAIGLLRPVLFEAEVPGAQLVHQLQDATAAACHAGERVFGNDHGQSRLFHEQLVDVAQQRAATGEHDAALGDVGAQLGRSLFQRL